MPERTTIETKFYTDPYIQSLPPTDKLLFKYLIDGPQTAPTLGIYELSISTMAFHTGLDKENIEHTLSRFAEAGKIHHVDGWVVVKNHFKHNPLRGNSMLIKNALRRFESLPWFIKDRITKSDDTLYIPYLDPSHTLYIAPEGGSNPSHSLPYSHSLPVPSQPGDNKSYPQKRGKPVNSSYAKDLARRKQMP